MGDERYNVDPFENFLNQPVSARQARIMGPLMLCGYAALSHFLPNEVEASRLNLQLTENKIEKITFPTNYSTRLKTVNTIHNAGYDEFMESPHKEMGFRRYKVKSATHMLSGKEYDVTWLYCHNLANGSKFPGGAELIKFFNFANQDEALKKKRPVGKMSIGSQVIELTQGERINVIDEQYNFDHKDKKIYDAAHRSYDGKLWAAYHRLRGEPSVKSIVVMACDGKKFRNSVGNIVMSHVVIQTGNRTV